jgi:putative ATPase
MNNVPLPELLRPKKLEDYIGQEHLVGKDGIIHILLNNNQKSDEASQNYFPSLIFWGPPGTGKTTLARIIANKLERPFHEFSAVNAKTKDIENIINEPKDKSAQEQDSQLEFAEKLSQKKAHTTPYTNHKPPIIFIDEIHRFNKAQQDKLLPHVERGDIIFIGATTENPSFEVIGPLLSRCRVLTLNQLTQKDLEKILKNGLKELKVKINKKAKDFIIEASNGDARVLLNVLEIASNLTNHLTLSTKHIEQALQRRQLSFDKQGEEYYNVISAYIKSMRASQVDAALYYLARMVEAGQDPLYIARRMVIFASEDIGMAQPTALVVANEVFRSCETIGYPECAINLAHGTVYMATAKKDRSAYEAYFAAVGDVQNFGNLLVPLKIRNPVTKLMKELDYGKGYEKYTKESLLPEKIKNKKYYKKF